MQVRLKFTAGLTFPSSFERLRRLCKPRSFFDALPSANRPEQ